jgi:hypothetical protein
MKRRSARGALLMGVALSVAGLAGIAAPEGSVAAATRASTIRLASQTAVLTGGHSGSTFQLGLTMTSPISTSKLGLSIQLYPRVTSRSAFESTLASKPVASVQDAFTISPLTTLSGVQPGPPSASPVSVSLPVSTSSVANGQTLTLDCDATGAVCAGVYPVQVALVDLSSGAPLSTFTTYLVYADPQDIGSAQPLALSWVLPLGAAPTTTSSGRAMLGQADLKAISTVLNTVQAAVRGVYVNLETYGETVLALAQGSTKPGAERSLLALLRSVATTQSGVGILPGTFVPVDMTGFENGRLAGELALQLALGLSTIRKLLPGAVVLNPAPAILTPPVDSGQVAMAESTGSSKFVIPDTDLAPDGWDYTPTEPFSLRLPASSDATNLRPKAIAADTQLAALFTPTTDPQLEAYQLVAELAEIFFERPTYSHQQRAVVLVTPSSWVPVAAMLVPFLNALGAAEDTGLLNVQSLTATMKDLAVGGNGQPASRTLASSPASSNPPNNPFNTPSRSAIASARTAATALRSLVPTDKSQLNALQSLILGGEASDLSAASQTALLGTPASEVAAWGSLVSLPQGVTVTLTASQGSIPITIASRANIPLHVILRVSNPEGGIRFPAATDVPLVLTGRTVANVKVSTRTSGDFALHVELVTPNGDLVIGSGNVTVRSTAISSLAIGLSAGAVLLLGVWWIRSNRRRRRVRKAAEASEDGEDGADPQVDDVGELETTSSS